MPKRKTARTKRGTEQAAKMAQKFRIKRVRLVSCLVQQEVREGPLPSSMETGIQCESRLHEKQKQILVDLDFTLKSRYNDASENKAAILIQARFRLVYESASAVKVTKEQLVAFGWMTATFNAWPYWREFVQSMTTRMGLPALTVPLFSLEGIKITGSGSDGRRGRSKKEGRSRSPKKT